MSKYILKWDVFHKTESKECPSLETLEERYLYCLAHDVNHPQMWIDGILVKEHKSHGWNIECPICQEARHQYAQKLYNELPKRIPKEAPK